jgi:hypothetical protein
VAHHVADDVGFPPARNENGDAAFRFPAASFRSGFVRRPAHETPEADERG